MFDLLANVMSAPLLVPMDINIDPNTNGLPGPFEMLLDPQVNANALTWAADANKARTSTNVSVGKGSSLVRAVEHRGFEPLTSSMPWKRATNCANAPGGLSPSFGRLD